MHIKIFNQYELEVIKSMNPILEKHKIPEEVLYEMEFILNHEKIQDTDFIALIMEPHMNDTADILKELCLYEPGIEIPDNNIHQIKVGGKKHAMKQKCVWAWSDIFIPSDDRTIYVVCCMKQKDLYSKKKILKP